MKLLARLLLILLTLSMVQAAPGADGSTRGTQSYDDFERPDACKACHTDIYRQWEQSMMSQAYTHHWDEIEYFELAVKHAEQDPTLQDAVDGCNGCHAPLAWLAGDLPPPRPAEGSRANESVSCEICHAITGYSGELPFNFNYEVDPGRVKRGSKPGKISPHHDTEAVPLFAQAEFCGICHNERAPSGVWVKSTHLEWKEGPYAEQGVPCQDCHMPKALGRSAPMAEEDMVAQHLFHGGHDPGKVRGTVELRMHPDEREVELDGTVVIQVQLFNGKTGHKFPTGSVEDRILWLHLEAEDSAGRRYHLPVDPKGFPGEEYTIASDALAYQDLGIPLGIEDFAGLPRDGVPVGDRIFRMPYFDAQGRMTIMQWNTASLGVDYRIGPRETKIENYTWELPDTIAPGRVTVTAELNYQLLVQPVAEFLKVPAEESAVMVVNTQQTWFEVYD
jgi:hypothetical protein